MHADNERKGCSMFGFSLDNIYVGQQFVYDVQNIDYNEIFHQCFKIFSFIIEICRILIVEAAVLAEKFKVGLEDLDRTRMLN